MSQTRQQKGIEFELNQANNLFDMAIPIATASRQAIRLKNQKLKVHSETEKYVIRFVLDVAR